MARNDKKTPINRIRYPRLLQEYHWWTSLFINAFQKISACVLKNGLSEKILITRLLWLIIRRINAPPKAKVIIFSQRDELLFNTFIMVKRPKIPYSATTIFKIEARSKML